MIHGMEYMKQALSSQHLKFPKVIIIQSYNYQLNLSIKDHL